MIIIYLSVGWGWGRTTESEAMSTHILTLLTMIMELDLI